MKIHINPSIVKSDRQLSKEQRKEILSINDRKKPKAQLAPEDKE